MRFVTLQTHATEIFVFSISVQFPNMSPPVNFPSFPDSCYSFSFIPKFNVYNPKVARCLHLINFQDAAEPFLKRPLQLEARKLFDIYMANFIKDWKEIPNHFKVPIPSKPSELHHSTYNLVKNNMWTPPTSLTILAEDHPRYGRYCTQYTEHDARFLYFVETAIDVFHTPIFARQDLNIITQLHLHVDQHLIAENEIIIEKNQASQLQRSRIKKFIALRRITRKALYPFNCLSLQPLEASRARLSKGGGM